MTANDAFMIQHHDFHLKPWIGLFSRRGTCRGSVTSASRDREGDRRSIVRKALTYTSGQMPSFTTLTTTGHSWQWQLYGVDNKLRYVQKTWYAANAERRTVFTEYRYDALGRRVLARTQRDSACTGSVYKCLAVIERFVWDGDQLLSEYRSPGGYGVSETNLNAIGSGSGDFYGNVRYTHASGIDEPLIVWGGGSAPEGIIPHLSWRGKFEAASDIAGNLLEGGSTPWIWPERYRDLNLANEVQYTPPDPTRWVGSLLEGQVDLNGLAYRRNRYYSPTTGRFTQEDPIGLAGGLNLYGFADGDPVNFSDPFGLCRIDVRANRYGSFGQYYHSFIVTTEPDATSTFFRGGRGEGAKSIPESKSPEGRAGERGLFGHISTRSGDYLPGTVIGILLLNRQLSWRTQVRATATTASWERPWLT